MEREYFKKLHISSIWVVLILISTIYFLVPAYALANTTLFNDNFTDIDGTNLAVHNAGWHMNNDSTYIDNNMARCNNIETCYNTWTNNTILNGCISVDYNYPLHDIYVSFVKRSDHRELGFFNSKLDNTLHISYWNLDTNTGGYLTSGIYDASSLLGLHTWKFCTNNTTVALYLDNLQLAQGTVSSDYVYAGKANVNIGYNDSIDNFLLEEIGETPTPIPTPTYPTSMDECKKSGWISFFQFKNQGSCVSLFESVLHHL